MENPYEKTNRFGYALENCKHNAWEEGHVAGKTEQAEIVNELVEACQKARDELVKANPYDRREVRFPSEAEQAITKAIAKAGD